jgi:D-alanyl-D-alanine carboxypeptidase/D-alanyl-D-alanine-endopeptidase (penicillin-binding protein 4)
MRMKRAVVWAVFAGAALGAHTWAAVPAEPSRSGQILPAPVVDAILASGLPSSSFGMYAQEVVGERTLVALNAERSYTMASTTKLVTSLAALDLLGPYYRWRTSAFALGTLANGKLVGDLLIVGGGNAQLTSAELQAWFGRMREQGLREIDGDIVLDRFAFQLSNADHARTPPQSADQPRHVWPDAMTLDEGLLGVTVEPTRGRRAALALKPALSDVRLDNQVAMTGGCDALAR